MTRRPPPIVRDAPPDGGWHTLERTDNDDALRTREALGLPTDRPIVMTGHHAEWWHPGLVAKYIAAQHLALAHSASWSWTLVDHKDADTQRIDVPMIDDTGVLQRRRLDLSASDVIEVAPSFVDRVSTLCSSWREMPSASPDARWLNSMRGALTPHVDLPDPVKASALLRTPVVMGLIERMRADPLRCAFAYNRAVVRTREAGLQPLHAGVDPGAIELPLWHTRDDGSLGRVFAGDMKHIDPLRLAPRALLLTGLVRMLLCDLFIHGVGGYVYDRATERWLRGWLGVELAPMGAVTADQTLPFDTPDVDEGDVARLKQYAHRARHQPALLGDAEAQRRKLEAVRSIRSMPRGSAERQAAYLRMHRELEEIRSRYSVELDSFGGEAMRLERQREASVIARSRTWPFVLFDRTDRDALREAVVRAITPA